MAKFNTVGFDDLEKEFLKQSEVAAKAIPKMLEAGAEVLVKAQKEEAKALKVENKGDLIRSIKATKVKQTDMDASITVTPTGKNKSGVRNAEVGFVNEYGTSKQPARPWMETANIKSEEKVHQAMVKVWEDMNNDS